MSIEKNIERIADALEALVAQGKNSIKLETIKTVDPVVESPILETKVVEKVEVVEKTKTTSKVDKRKEVIAELDRLGIKYAPSSSTAALEKKLRSHTPTKDVKVEDVPTTLVPPKEETAQEIMDSTPSNREGLAPVTASEGRARMQAFYTEYGEEAARGILAKLGVQRVSELDPDGLIDMVKAITYIEKGGK